MNKCWCGSTDLVVCYEGNIRDGTWGKFQTGVIHECQACHTQMLDRSLWREAEFYRQDYRPHVGETAEQFTGLHDAEQATHFAVLKDCGLTVRERAVVDIGCGGGSFIDHIAGLTDYACGVDPGNYERAYVFKSVLDVPFKADLAVSFSVIEHVGDPVTFLRDIASIMDPDGDLIVSTPNLNDFRMIFPIPEFASFFYRTQHNWYFSEESLVKLLTHCGFDVMNPVYKQTYGLENALRWARDRKPSLMNGKVIPNDSMASLTWTHYLEQHGLSDRLYLWARKPAA